MILLLAVFAGFVAGYIRAGLGGRRLSSPALLLVWLAVVAFVPQWLAFYLPATRQWVTDDWAAIALVCSQVLLLVFVWSNRRQAGFALLGFGLALNLLVIFLNGGLMPISPETVTSLATTIPSAAWQVGGRLGSGKDIVLTAATTRLAWLSDCFVFPDWLPYRVAFSVGDTLIPAGAFWFLWTLGGIPTGMQRETKLEQRVVVWSQMVWRRIEPIDERGGHQ